MATPPEASSDPRHPSRASDLRRGALAMVGSALCFAVMSAGVKSASATLPNSMIVFFRNAVALLALVPWAWRVGLEGLRTRHLAEHLVRAGGGLAAMYCFFYAISRMRLADAVLLNYALPLLLPLVERAWLREIIPPRLWPPLLLGFAGILVILRPGSAVFEPAALLALASAAFAAVAQVGIRRLTETEPVTRIVFYFSFLATAVSAVPAALAWVPPSAAAWAVLLGTGLFAAAGQLLLTRAYSFAPAGQVGPFLYSGVVFSGAIDWLLWRRLPDGQFGLGALAVTAAAILALRRRSLPAPPVE